MKSLCSAAAIFASRAPASVTCWTRYWRLSSKNVPISCGSVSMALFVTKRSAFSPHPYDDATANATSAASKTRPAQSRCSISSLSLWSRLHVRVRKLAMTPSVQVVQHEADGQPSDEANPVRDRQARHQQQARENCNHRCQDAPRRAKRSRTIRFAVAKNQYAARHQRERE